MKEASEYQSDKNLAFRNVEVRPKATDDLKACAAGGKVGFGVRMSMADGAAWESEGKHIRGAGKQIRAGKESQHVDSEVEAGKTHDAVEEVHSAAEPG